MKALSIVLSIIAILLIGLFIGYLLWGPTWQIPQEFKYDILKDVLTIVLTFAVVTIAVVGYLVYRVVTQKLTDETEKRIADVSKGWIVWLAALTGYSFSKIGHNEQAIRLTEEAYEYAQELDERDLKNQLLLGEIRNNLASYYVETGQKADIAQGLAAYIHNISHKFPKQRAAWEDTYRKVFEAFPEQK